MNNARAFTIFLARAKDCCRSKGIYNECITVVYIRGFEALTKVYDWDECSFTLVFTSAQKKLAS